ncbi:Sushi domain containing 1, partial [Caligus rogercresseyi]
RKTLGGPRNGLDDPGYESLHHQRRYAKSGVKPRFDPNYVSLGIDAPEVREQVYETLRKNSSGYESMQRSISSGTTGSG